MTIFHSLKKIQVVDDRSSIGAPPYTDTQENPNVASG